MDLQNAKQQTNLEQITHNKNRFYVHSNNLLDSFEETGDLKKVSMAASLARVHRVYLRDEIMFTSPPKKSKSKK